MASTWNKQEFILLPSNHGVSCLFSVTEDHLCRVNGAIARILCNYCIICVRVLVKQMV